VRCAPNPTVLGRRGAISSPCAALADAARCRAQALSPRRRAAGIGAVFGVDATGAVFFNTAVPGSSCGDAVSRQQLRTGDTLFAVDGAPVYRAPLNVVASKLLGASGSRAVVTFKRGEETIVLELER
jgi:C-terminal processing protease CtpA/Prc